jgi:hypothetical protein
MGRKIEQAAIAQAELGYEPFERIFASERFKTRESLGAAVLRLLWAGRGGFRRQTAVGEALSVRRP